MTAVDLTKAKEVIDRPNANEANRYLKAGWTLIGTASGKDEQGYPLTTYSLAWCGEGAPKDPEY
ncbi:hypothetical protein D3C81_1732800 [compost metagenome]